jgi:integrase/recombinase XerD
MTSAEQVAAALNDVLTDLGSDASRRSYSVDWNRFAEWLAGQEIDPLAVTPKVIRDHVIWMRDERKLKRGTIGKALSTIREVYRALVNAEAMTINPARETKPPKMDNALKTPVLTEEQTRTLLSSLPCSTWRERRDRLVLLALFGLGFRRAEIARIHTRDFDGNVITATVKGSKTITVAVPDWLMGEFRMWRISAHIFGGPMFPRSSEPGARAISGAIVYEIVTAVAKKAGFAKGSVTPHCMRRTNITIAGEKGVSLKARQLAVGHSNSATTERYDKARDARREAPGNAFVSIVGGVK